jgi:3-deoxy-D-arabino-heptulosonate 7-phosphate (DAHP) synthase
VLNAVSRFPIIVDPSHAAGLRFLVPALARVAVAAGADGLLVEVHPRPDQALSDGMHMSYARTSPCGNTSLSRRCKLLARNDM